jgi:hypothetical protein
MLAFPIKILKLMPMNQEVLTFIHLPSIFLVLIDSSCKIYRSFE